MKEFIMFNTWKIQMFNKYLLNEQAISRSDAESGVSHIASVIIEHLLKVLIFAYIRRIIKE